MAKRKGPDKFRVGQRVVLVLSESTGFARFNGRLAVVTAPRVFGRWKCNDPIDISRLPAVQESWRYMVETSNRKEWGVEESMLRAIYDGVELSTWDKFAKATGIDLAAACLVAKPVRKARSRGKSGEVQHG